VFNRLPESNARRQRRLGGLALSTGAHLFFIALAVRATGLRAAPSLKPETLTPLYIAPPEPTPPPPAPRRLIADPGMATVPKQPALPTIVTPDVPNTIPDIGSMSSLLEPAFDSGRVSATGQPGGSSPNVADGGAPLRADVVEKAVVALPGTATPHYPTMLQRAGLEGDVRAQFVVDTLGRVENGSVRILDATHDQFSAAVRDALGRARFKPAEAGGHKVRQLVEQTFTFRIQK